jgi:Dyp-type peroxidase family protein
MAMQGKRTMWATSNHLRGASELMLVAEIKDGFTQNPTQLVSYATRLGQLLDLLLEGRRASAEKSLLPGAGPIERLDTIYSTQWAIQQLPQQSQLIVSATFDSSFEAYFRNLQRNAGELLDAIFCHCRGYSGHTCADGYEPFAHWIRAHQVQTRFFHTATPDLTVADIRYLRKLASGDIDNKAAIGSVEQEEALARGALPLPDADARRLQHAERYRLVHALGELRRSFSPDERLGPRTEQTIYDQAVRSLLDTSLDAALRQAAMDALPWLGGLAPRPKAAPAPVAVSLASGVLKQIQSEILSPCNEGRSWPQKLKHGCLVLLQCDDATAARSLLRRLQPHITTASVAAEPFSGDRVLNLGLTCAGLRRLGLSEDLLSLLPVEFRQGMEKRAGLLGDIGPFAHPSRWEAVRENWPSPSQQARTVPLSAVDAVLILHGTAAEADGDHAWSAQHPLHHTLSALALDGAGVHILHVQPLRRYPRDHFELGEETQVASQPIPLMTHDPGEPHAGPSQPASGAPGSRHDMALGELLLGYPDRHGDVARWTRTSQQSRELFENGSFLVVRKLQQDVPGFQSFIDRSVRDLGLSAPTVSSWLLGRRPTDGRTLVDPGGRDPGNDFDYSGSQAAHCPLHAHVRRANPRLGFETPRIMRRSVAYGSCYDEHTAQDNERGLMFMAYNANIAEQFEVIQRWLNGSNITGLPSTTNDLIAGLPQRSGAQRWAPNAGPQRLPAGVHPFTSLRWGMYLFVPSLTAIEKLAEPTPQAPCGQSARPDAGEQLIDSIGRLEGLEHQRRAWQELLEENARTREAGAVWAAIRRRPEQTLETAYGLLISGVKNARAILEDDGRQFSVEIYAERLARTIDGHYLGLDAMSGRHARLADAPNDYLTRLLSPSTLRKTAREAAAQLLGRTRQNASATSTFLDLRLLALHAVGCVARDHLGMPPVDPGPALIELTQKFTPVSRYCFQPFPDAALEREAVLAGQYLVKAYAACTLRSGLAEHLRTQAPSYTDESLIRSAVIGAIVGFAPPAVANIVGIVRRWLLGGELQRLVRVSRDSLVLAVVEAMQQAPVPPTLYRSVQKGARLAERELSAGIDHVVIGTQSVCLDARERAEQLPWQWMFGGARQGTLGDSHAVHGCPARNAAVEVMVGVVEALLDYPDLELSGPIHLDVG